MTIDTTTPEESAQVFARHKRGEIRILRMARGNSNSAWTFTVSQPEAQPELVPATQQAVQELQKC